MAALMYPVYSTNFEIFHSSTHRVNSVLSTTHQKLICCTIERMGQSIHYLILVDQPTSCRCFLCMSISSHNCVYLSVILKKMADWWSQLHLRFSLMPPLSTLFQPTLMLSARRQRRVDVLAIKKSPLINEEIMQYIGVLLLSIQWEWQQHQP